MTLITTSTTYILAEATQIVSLLAGGQYANSNELWFATASIPRPHGMSQHALDPQPYMAKLPDGQEYTIAALVFEDLTQAFRFSTNEYACRGVTFYTDVLILSENRFTIGVST